MQDQRPLNGLSRIFWLGFGICLVVFHLGLIFYGLVPNLISRPIHMAFALPWILVLAARPGWERISGTMLAALGVAACLWIALNRDMLGNQYGFLEGTFQIGIAAVLILVVLEAARRAIGWPLPTVAAAALLYGLFGQHIPGEFGHSGTPLASFLGTLTIAEGGLWGSLTSVSVNVVALFVIFGAFLNAGEAGQGFMNIAAAAAGRLNGGAAKVSVLSSALFGSISGSASANVASTGAITLPAMTKLGYPKRLAGAVEAVASSGGQIMPPLMGAGAFVMVELTGVPYTSVMAAALPPALLYFFAVWIGINAYARRFELAPIAAEDKPATRDVVITAAFFLVPFAVLMWGMFVSNVTPQYAACLATLVGAAMLIVDGRLKIDLRVMAVRLEGAFLGAGRQVAMIASIILCASLIIGVLSITGLGVKITSLILSGSGGLLWPSLLLTAVACLVLGMEVPTTAAYVICISVAGPALIELGLQPLQAHLFVFWFALLSTITPPVCGAVFIAAGMVGENWLKVAVTAMALGVGLYVIPLGMIANPAVIALEANPLASVLASVKLAIGLALLSYGLIGTKKLVPSLALIGVGIAVVILDFSAI
ncbi:TRAP transporter fused permease subunit [Hwanghaeella grinnelliae]|uniref:TRAP transporter fused permease subunit n=1 Tax=Hwanghaeella grinnelliae TaxID=2500179 RepID=A0A3S2VNL7_9PROT|nr:TRAP transporter fused permease subunit [Hwanghaeella grinnelliae]RVU34834.1 TRAP transporter fused permease subunit [Hwanghaeella grinnelliae]